MVPAGKNEATVPLGRLPPVRLRADIFIPPVVPVTGLAVVADEVPRVEAAMIGVGIGLPAGSVVVAGPVGAGSVGLVLVQITTPVDVAGVGVHVVPSRVTVSPRVTPVHLIVLSA